MDYLKKTRTDIFEFWNLLFSIAGLVFLCQHFFFGLYHFQECDSSSLFEFLKNQSNEDMNYFINNFSPDVFKDLRYWLANISIKIPFIPLKKFLQLPYLSTYTPLMGLIFGGLSNQTYSLFYYFSTLINALALLISSILFYLTTLKLNISKPISFCFASLLLTFYSTNSYSYHLGSTIWYLLSISAGIYILSLENKILKDLSSSILQFLSYPYIVWYVCELSLKIISTFYINKFRFKYILISIKDLFKERLFTIVGIFFNIVLFLPFNSGYRGGPDIRGLYTIFSFEPLNNNNNDIFYVIFSIILYFFLFWGVLKNINYFKKSIKIENFNLFNKNLIDEISLDKRFMIFLQCFTFLFIVVFLVLVRKLSFTTTRHSLFIIPCLLLFISYGAEEFNQRIKKVSYLNLNKLIPTFLIIFITITFFISNNSNFQRIDILKSNNIPSSIINFVKNNNDISYSIIGCSPHYKYANFDNEKINYNRKESNKLSNLYDNGKKLLISQRPIISQKEGQYKNEFTKYLFFKKPRLGDEINVKSKDIKIKIIGKPFISKTSVYYDSLNEKSKIFNLFHSFRFLKTLYINKFQPNKIEINNINNKSIYNWYDFYTNATGEEYRYPRPNDIWLIPIEVQKLN
tara:strand:+ start:3860 stop:5749 length:1890 start_codon:yes stop_codon:yes gene_type:complete